MRFEPGQVYSFVMGTPWLGHVHTAKVKWHYASNVFNPFTWRMRSVPAIYLNRIVVHNYETNNRCKTKKQCFGGGRKKK